MKSKTALGLLAAALAVTALAACGGGDDDDSTAPAGSESTENAAPECAATDLTFTNLETGVSGTATTALSEFDVLTFVAAHYSDEDEWSHTDLLVDGPRTMTVTAVGDTFCFEIDFVDQQKEFSGTVAAPVFRP